MAQRSQSRPLVSAFAHLMPGARAARADEDPKMKGRKAEDEKPDDEDEDPKAKKKAEGDENEVTDDDEGVDGEETPDLDDVKDPDESLDEDAAPEESDSDPKMRKAAKAGRKAERGRWTKVMQHPAAAGRVAAACQLLSTTRASASSVIGTLKALPAAAEPAAASGRDRLDSRMAARPAPKVGVDAKAPTPEGDFGAFSAATIKKVRG